MMTQYLFSKRRNGFAHEFRYVLYGFTILRFIVAKSLMTAKNIERATMQHTAVVNSTLIHNLDSKTTSCTRLRTKRVGKNVENYSAPCCCTFGCPCPSHHYAGRYELQLFNMEKMRTKSFNSQNSEHTEVSSQEQP